MFVALRDLRFARGRFVLIGSVVALITVLVGFLSGLTGGLAIQNVSGVLSLPADRLVFSAPTVTAPTDGTTSPSFSESSITEQMAQPGHPPTASTRPSPSASARRAPRPGTPARRSPSSASSPATTQPLPPQTASSVSPPRRPTSSA